MIILHRIKLLISLTIFFLIVACSSSEEVQNEVVISFQTKQTQAIEDSNNSIFIPLSINGNLTEDSFLQYEVSGTADFPGDVSPLTSPNFIIPKGATSFNIEMVVLEDAVNEFESETLTLTLIGSNNVIIGENSFHDILISADDLITVSFSQPETNTVLRNDVDVNIVLSKAYDENITVGIIDQEHERDFTGEYYFGLSSLSSDITFLAGSTEATLSLFHNGFYRDSDFSGIALRLKIGTIRLESGFFGFTEGIIEDPDESKLQHSINIVSSENADNIRFEMEWTSSNSNVDLDLYLFDENEELIDRSEKRGVNVSETIDFLDKSNGKYFLVVSWFRGTGSADITSIVSPSGSATFNGSNSPVMNTFSNVTEEGLQSGNIIATILKDGNVYMSE